MTTTPSTTPNATSPVSGIEIVVMSIPSSVSVELLPPLEPIRSAIRPRTPDGGVRIGGTRAGAGRVVMPSAPMPPMRERGLAVEERQHVGVEVDAQRECGQRPERIERARDLLALGHVAGDREAGFERAAQAEDGDLGHASARASNR